MEEIEVPLEQSQEHILEHAKEHGEHSEHTQGGWIGRLALTSAILAVLAAVAALFAGHHANEAMIEQMHASDNWNFYQAKGIKSAILTARADIIQSLGKTLNDSDKEKIQKYKDEQAEIKEKADEETKASGDHMHTHEIFAEAVTMFQVAIAISAIAILTRKRRFWYVSLAFGAIGLMFFAQALLSTVIPKKAPQETKTVMLDATESATSVQKALLLEVSRKTQRPT
jgi:hypothetical protein